MSQYPRSAADEFVNGIMQRLGEQHIYVTPGASVRAVLYDFWYEEVAPQMDWA